MNAAIFATLLAFTATGASAQTINTGNPSAFSKALAELGYAPTALKSNDGSPVFTAKINDWDTVFVFGGCEAETNCKYAVLVSGFTDVKNPPRDWVNRINRDLDLGKLWVNDDYSTSFSVTIPMGGNEIPTAAVRYVLEEWSRVVQYISSSAVEAKLTK